jgi:signal transduction histidine kinase
MNRLGRLFSRWAATEELAGGDLDLQHRAGLAVRFSGVAAAVSFAFSVIYFASFRYVPASFVLAGVGAGFVLVPVLMRATGSVSGAGHAMAALVMVVCTYLAMLRPDFPVSAITYYGLVPLVVVTLSGNRAAVAWLVVTTAAVAFFAVRVRLGLAHARFVARPDAVILADASAVVGLAVLLWQVTVHTDRARRVLEARRRELQEKLQERLEGLVAERTQELQLAVKELESFAYTVAHDLRTPLRAIDGFSAALVEEYEGELDACAQDYLHRIRAAAQRMAQLIDDVLQLSRVARVEPRVVDVDLSELAKDVVAALRRSDPERDVAITIQPGLAVAADAVLLRGVVENLLDNAWKFTRNQPEAHIEVGACAAPDGTAYFVRDDGVGFDMTLSASLFTPFHRLHGQDEFPGTGIGLATAQRAVERHHGRIWAEAAVGAGATFFFTLGRHRG